MIRYRRAFDDSVSELRDLDRQISEQNKVDELNGLNVQGINKFLNTLQTNKEAILALKDRAPEIYYSLINLIENTASILKDHLEQSAESVKGDEVIDVSRESADKVAVSPSSDKLEEEKDHEEVDQEFKLEDDRDRDSEEGDFWNQVGLHTIQNQQQTARKEGDLSEKKQDEEQEFEKQDEGVELPEEYKNHTIVDEHLMRLLHHKRRPLRF